VMLLVIVDVIIIVVVFFILLSVSCSQTNAQASYEIKVVQSARDTKDRLSNKTSIYFSTNDFESNNTITINPQKQYQQILGFGGAFTEAAAYVYSQLNDSVQQQVMDLLFGPNGQHYGIGRVQMNSCDFSLASYSFDDIPNDFSLKYFDISHDKKWLIPFIKQALSVSDVPLKIFATPWSPPAWMKGNGKMTGSSYPGLKEGDNYHQAWALYYTKFLDAYATQGIDIWGITVQNEPENDAAWEACVYSAEQERDFIKNYLGPQLASTHPNLTIMIYDHNKDDVVNWAQTILSDPDAAQYVKGTAFHWYSGPQFENVLQVHNTFPDKFVLATEACTCPVQLDGWENGEAYGYDIIGDLNSWSIGWTDWNLLLDITGGPNHLNNFCDAGLMIDIEAQELHIQPQYFYFGQISRFVTPGSYRIGVDYNSDRLSVSAFLTPANQISVVVMNSNSTAVELKLTDGSMYSKYVIPAHAITTFTYNNFGKTKQELI